MLARRHWANFPTGASIGEAYKLDRSEQEANLRKLAAERLPRSHLP